MAHSLKGAILQYQKHGNIWKIVMSLGRNHAMSQNKQEWVWAWSKFHELKKFWKREGKQDVDMTTESFGKQILITVPPLTHLHFLASLTTLK